MDISHAKLNDLKPDMSVSPDVLEREYRAYLLEVNQHPQWLFRESYVDRGPRTPFYFLEFQHHVDELGDDLYDQPLFQSANPALSGITMTRQDPRRRQSYWKAISNQALTQRLTRFMQMYRENYLQPPGQKNPDTEQAIAHDKFYERIFLYKLTSPRKAITGVAPKMFAGGNPNGAMCGQIVDDQGDPVDNVVIELVKDDRVLKRTTRNGGLFWFTNLDSGNWKVRIPDKQLLLSIVRQDEFSSFKGWVSDQQGDPVAHESIKLIAPDDEVFDMITDPSGKFSAYSIPAYPVPDSVLADEAYRFPFDIQNNKQDSISNGGIGGILLNAIAQPLPDHKVLLMRDGTLIHDTVSNALGEFLCTGLEGGDYQLQVEGCEITVQPEHDGTLVADSTTLEPVNRMTIMVHDSDSALSTERSSAQGHITSESLSPGPYTVKLSYDE